MLSCFEGLDRAVSPARREPGSREPWTVRGRPARLSCFEGLDREPWTVSPPVSPALDWPRPWTVSRSSP